MTIEEAVLPVLKAKDFASDQDVRWCPGCGDYAILNQVKKVLAKMGKRKEQSVFIAGIGCSSRFPYYMDTYGFHTIHGRAPAVATGVKLANSDLDVWMVTGDGDGLSIGGNHLIHMLRRNVNLNIMLFNNRIYGLTKGQYSPTSETGKQTKSTPMGSIETPLNPIAVAMAAEATFVARAVDVSRELGSMMERAAQHHGSSFLEIYQDCNVFNHKAYGFLTDKEVKLENSLNLEHGQPMVYGKDKDKGIRLGSDGRPETVTLGDGISEADLWVHDETDVKLATLLSRMNYPEFPEPLGVLYCAEQPCYEDVLNQQVTDAIEKRGRGDLEKLFFSGDTWVVE